MQSTAAMDSTAVDSDMGRATGANVAVKSSSTDFSYRTGVAIGFRQLWTMLKRNTTLQVRLESTLLLPIPLHRTLLNICPDNQLLFVKKDPLS